MGNVGLLYVGAGPVNGLMLIGRIPGKSAAILNFFVGGVQVIFATLIILQANNDQSTIFAAAGLCLFGFAYLYVGILQATGWSGVGLGWFSLFVAGCATVVGILQFTTLANRVFGAIWLTWAVLWFLFFLVLGLGKTSLTLATGWFTIFISQVTATIPAILLLTGNFESTKPHAVLVGGIALLSFIGALVLGRARRPAVERTARVASSPVV